MMLDKSRKHHLITTVSESYYLQDGIKYSLSGNPLDAPADMNSDESATQERSLEDMHWKQLKQMVESIGFEYTSKTEAIRMLSGKGQAVPGESESVNEFPESM